MALTHTEEEVEVHFQKFWQKYQTARSLHEALPFLSHSTIRRWLSELQKRGLIVAEKPRSNVGDHTHYYKVNFLEYQKLYLEDQATRSNLIELRGVQNV